MKLFDGYTKKQKYYSIVFLLGFLFKYNFLFIKVFNTPNLLLLLSKNVIILLFIIFFIFPLAKNKKGREFIFWFMFIFTLFFLFNIWYNRYFGNYLSLSDMMMGQGFRPFKVLLLQLFKIIDLLFIVDIVILAFYRTKEKQTINLKSLYINLNIKDTVLVLFFIVLILFSQFFIYNNFLGEKKPLELYNEDTSLFVNVYGLLPLYLYEFYVNYVFDQEKIVNNELAPPPEEELVGESVINKNQNIIVIQVESLDNKIINYEHNGKEVTPFLNELKNESLFFDNFYAQHINGSFDAEFSFLTSIYPINKNYGFKVNDLSEFDSLVRQLNNEGYETMAFHGNDKEFFHRYKAFPELGFDKFYSKADFSFDNRVYEMQESVFGLNDYDFFLQSFDYLKKAEKPFFAFLITLTSHTPFDTYPSEERIKEYNDINNPLVRDYFNSITFVDKSIENFFNKIEASGLDENTLIIIYSDHNAGITKKEYQSDKKYNSDINIKIPENIPLFIKHPKLDNEISNKEGTTTDLAPTILDIIGKKKSPEEFLGKSLLNEKDNPILFLHEIPLILFEGQLFSRQNEEINKIGYSEEAGDKNIKIDNRDEINNLIEYMKGIILKRRID
ncbi:MAG: LTA synthase family protein [Bacillota bacterium]